MSRYSYKNALVELTEYAQSEGFGDISFDGEYSFISWSSKELYKPKKLVIESAETFEHKVYLMLHELGHHELRKNWNNFRKKFPVTAYAEQVNLEKKEKKYMRRDSYLVSSLEEEFMAWEKGFKLGTAMGIKINMSRWISLKSKCIKGYIGYYANLQK